LPKKKRVPWGWVYLFDICLSVLDNTAGPQKNCGSLVWVRNGDGRTYDSDVRLGMFLRYTSKHAVPVRAAEMGRGAERGDGIAFGADVLDLDGTVRSGDDRVDWTYEDVVHVVFLDLGREVNRDLDPVLGVLFLDGVEERVEPFGGAKVTDDPCKVDLCGC
jgi:hypothetical protein